MRCDARSGFKADAATVVAQLGAVGGRACWSGIEEIAD
jgi:hypothetical protein